MLLKKRAEKPKPNGIHSYDHDVAKEVCDWFGVKEFGLWLGQCKKIGAGQMKANLDYLKKRGIKSPKYLMVMCRKK